MQIQKQTLVESEEFLILLSEEEQAIIAGGDGKHSKPDSKSALRRGLGLGLKVGARAIPGVNLVASAVTIGVATPQIVRGYRGSRIHNESGHWWSFL